MKDHNENGGSATTTRVLALAVLFALCCSFVLPAAGAQETETLEEARKERESLQRDRASALRELAAAKLRDEELAELLNYLNVEIATTELAVEGLRQELVVVESELDAARLIQTEAVSESIRLREEIATVAVEGFVRSTRQEEAFFGSESLSDAYRQNSLIREANAEPTELLDRVRIVEEQGRLAEATVADAASETIELEEQLQARLAGLENDLAESAELKLEWEARVSEFTEKVSERDRDIREVEAEILELSPTATSGPATAPPAGDPSVQGYDWPLIGRVSSGFGPRVHPIFKTRRMHTGLDIGGRSGEPIYAAKGGTILSAGWRGGYGNTVVIDHGGGFSTLYAHQSRMAVGAGQTVQIGEVIGYVGSTGWSTGPHLHYELRLNGKPIDPLPYLP